MVGASGFEPEASCAQGRRATRLRYAPTDVVVEFTVLCDFVDAVPSDFPSYAADWKQTSRNPVLENRTASEYVSALAPEASDRNAGCILPKIEDNDRVQQTEVAPALESELIRINGLKKRPPQ